MTKQKTLPMSTLTIVVKKPGEPAYKAECENSLEAIKTIVVGYVQYVPGGPLGLPSGVDLYCNEDAKMLELEPNIWLFGGRDQVWGNFFLVGGDPMTGENRSLTDAEVEQALAWCEIAAV